jgi:UDP-N-acetyl-D-glucosamine dehydrogenase
VRNLAALLRNRRGQELAGARVLIIGATYKAGVADIRESAARRVFDELVVCGAKVQYHDPLVREMSVHGDVVYSQELTAELLTEQDCVAVITAQSGVDWDLVVSRAELVIDATGSLRAHDAPNVVSVWCGA